MALSFSALMPAAAATPIVIPGLEVFRDRPRSSRKAPRTENGRRYRDYYSEKELETADALILLSLSRGGTCVFSSSTAAESASEIDSRDIQNNDTDTMPHAVSISRDEKNPLLLRIKTSRKVENQILSKSSDTCDREYSSSPQTVLWGHETGHRPTTPTMAKSNNVTLKVFECSICHNVYNSGQALGGHKRKHYNVDKASASSHTATYSGCGIDLNLPPVLHDD